MVCVEIVWEQLVMTYGTTHNMDTFSPLFLFKFHMVLMQKYFLSFSTTIQYVIYTYMKHLGVRVKEPRSLESKRVRINFLPKIKVL